MIFDIDHLFNPFEMCRQRTAVSVAETITLGLLCSNFTRCSGFAKCRLNISEAQLELIWI
jgi:hypothetical protein